MSKKIKKRKAKSNVKPTDIKRQVSSILRPLTMPGKLIDAIEFEYYTFLSTYEKPDFEEILRILLRNEDVRGFLNFFKYDLREGLFCHGYLASDRMEIDRLYSLYKIAFEIDSVRVKEYALIQYEVEDLIFLGDIDGALSKINDAKETIGYTYILVCLEFVCLALNNNIEALNDQHDLYLDSVQNKSNNNFVFRDSIGKLFWIAESSDANQTVRLVLEKDISEFVNGGANDLAAFYSLTHLPLVMYKQVDVFYGVYECQWFNTYDCYFYLKKMQNNLSDITNSEVNRFSGMSAALNEITDSVDSAVLQKQSAEGIDCDKTFDHMVSLYEECDYENLVNYYESFSYDSYRSLSVFNMLAKSYLILGREVGVEIPIFQRGILESLIKIYKLDGAREAIKNLKSIAIRMANTRFSLEVLSSLCIAVDDFLDEESRVRVSFMLESLSGRYTLAAKDLSVNYQFINCSEAVELVGHRKIRFDVLETIERDPKECCKHLLKKFKHACVTPKDIIDLHVHYYISANKISELIDYCSDELIHNEESIVCFPRETIRKYIQDESYYTESSLVFSYFYNKSEGRVSSDFSNELFEEFIYINGGKSPSEVFIERESNTEKINFIFMKIATISAIEYLGLFDSTAEICIERLRILTTLMSKKVWDELEVEREFEETVNKAIVQQGFAYISNSKISVNFEEIYDEVSDEVENLISGVVNDRDVDEKNDESKYVEIRTDQTEKMAVVPKGKKGTVVRRIIDIYTEVFNTRLDEVLSGEIRHGFFSNLMCSKLQMSNLLTEESLAGKFQTNNYWMNYYNIVDPKILKKIDSVLMVFSGKFYELIDEAEGWMKVGGLLDPGDSIFRVEISMEDYELLRDMIYEGTALDKVIKFLDDLHQLSLNSCLEEMKNTLNEKLAPKLEVLFQETKERLDIERKGASLTDLIDAIGLAQDQIRGDLITICEWFSMKGGMIDHPVLLETLISTAENCFRQSFFIRQKISITSSSKVLVEPDHIYSLVISLINLFSNAAKYGSNESVINVHVTETVNGYCLDVINSINKSRVDMLKDGDFSRLEARLDSSSNVTLLKEEGGSGLYKSKYYLSKSSLSYSLTPRFNENEFIVRIQYGS
ncbi:MAG: hypothetical protein V7765_19335 [Oleispira sp.]